MTSFLGVISFLAIGHSRCGARSLSQLLDRHLLRMIIEKLEVAIAKPFVDGSESRLFRVGKDTHRIHNGIEGILFDSPSLFGYSSFNTWCWRDSIPRQMLDSSSTAKDILLHAGLVQDISISPSTLPSRCRTNVSSSTRRLIVPYQSGHIQFDYLEVCSNGSKTHSSVIFIDIINHNSSTRELYWSLDRQILIAVQQDGTGKTLRQILSLDPATAYLLRAIESLPLFITRTYVEMLQWRQKEEKH